MCTIMIFAKMTGVGPVFDQIHQKSYFYISVMPQNQSKQLDIVGAVIFSLEVFQNVCKHVFKTIKIFHISKSTSFSNCLS